MEKVQNVFSFESRLGRGIGSCQRVIYFYYFYCFKTLREDICCNGNDISVDASRELTRFDDNFGQERVFVELSAHGIA